MPLTIALSARLCGEKTQNHKKILGRRSEKPVSDHLKIDRQLLHEFLYRKRNSRDVLRVQHKELAEDLGVGHYTISRIFREFIQEGRVKKLGLGRDGVNYLIRDPGNFAQR